MSAKPTSRPAGTIMLPTARLAQLHTLAALQDPPISTTELIEELIGREIEAGTLPDELPGFTVGMTPHRSGWAVAFTMEQGFGFDRMQPADAAAIADVLDDVALPGPGRGKSIGTGDAQLKIAKVGRGVVIAGTGEGQRRSLTPRMARDLARQLRRAADLATKAS